MTKITDYQIDGTFIIRDMDAAELAQVQSQKDFILLAKAEADAAAAAKAELLARLGITADEAKLLL